ncbi:MAG: MnhB domain-containing protein [Candidatus Geothermincolia bacterium]
MMKKAVVILALGLLAAALLYAVAKMPRMGDAGSPDKTFAVPRYIERGLEEAGNRSIPNDVFLNYRAYDTLGGVVALFTALCAAMVVLDRGKRVSSPAEPARGGVSSSVMLRTIAIVIVPLTVMFAAYVSLMGVNTLGYSLQSGTMIGGAIILLTLVFSLLETSRRLRPGLRAAFESSGLALFLAVGLLGVILGAHFLTLSLPGLAGKTLQVERAVMMYVLDLGIGVSAAGIITSVIFSLMREGEVEQ